MYLTYDEYRNMGGQILEETTFFTFYFEAQTIIDWWTFNRLQKEEVFPETVKRCVYKLIDLIANKHNAMNNNSNSEEENSKAGIVSESNDGVSTQYNVLSAKQILDAFDNEVKITINMYLQGVKNSLGHKLLYRGVYPDE